MAVPRNAASAAAEDNMLDEVAIPVIDMGPLLQASTAPDFRHSQQYHCALQHLTREIRGAYEKYGFAYLKNHGISLQLLDGLMTQHEKFFSLPQDKKNELQYTSLYGFRGFVSKASARMAKTGIVREVSDDAIKPNMQEALVFASENPGTELHGKDAWPDEKYLPEFRAAIEAYRAEVSRVGHALLPAFGTAIGGNPWDFARKFEQPTTFLRLNHYPPAIEGVDPLVNMAAATHSDYGSFTILAPAGPGLQVRTPDGKRWIAVPDKPGHLVMNVGDFLHRWSGGTLRATPHRVIHADTTRPRQSVAFFFDPHMATVEPTTGLRWGNHLMNRLSTNYVGRMRSLSSGGSILAASVQSKL